MNTLDTNREFRTVHVAAPTERAQSRICWHRCYRRPVTKQDCILRPSSRFQGEDKNKRTAVLKNFVRNFVSKHKAFFDTLNPSFFEISVLMAFEYFRINNVDIAVIEVGLGGRLDSTNIITPILSVISNIGIDHTEFLGNTLAEIAAEKAGIIKPGVPVVVGETKPETKPVFSEVSDRLNSPLTFADEQLKISESFTDRKGAHVMRLTGEITGSLFSKPSPVDLVCGLNGHYQRKNVATVLTSLAALKNAGLLIDGNHISRGIARVCQNTGLTGRWQIVRKEPLVICDTAHNPDGIKEVMRQALGTASGHIHLVMGFVSDKDVKSIFNLMPADSSFYFCRLSVPRTMQKEVLMKAASESGIRGSYFESAGEAYEAALKNLKNGDMILVTGSNFCVADFLEYYKQKA